MNGRARYQKLTIAKSERNFLKLVTVSVRLSFIRSAKWALFGFVVFLFTLIWLADSGRGQWLFDLVRLVPGGDKTGHFVLFGLLSLLLNVVWRASTSRCGEFTVLKGSLLVAVFAVGEEVSQLFFATRTFDLLDLVAGLVGVWLFGRLAARYAKPELILAGQPARAIQRKR